MRPIGCLEASVRNHHYSLHNQQERSFSRPVYILYFIVAACFDLLQSSSGR